ncbi:MAG: hypothetical protein J6U52_03125 [Alistipes sp.]|jgi:hypothetical protein|nr:hypothetical protein [Alistipes sp.]
MLFPLLGNSQTLTNKDQRHMNLRLLSLVEQYEANATVYDEVARYTFLDMYKDQTVKVYSDMMDYEAGQMITVEEYMNTLTTKQNVSIAIKNVTRKPYEWKDDAWHTTVTFEKSMTYNDENSILFSTDEQYKADYLIALNCVYDPDADRCYITSIDGSLPDSVTIVPRRFTIVNRNSENDDRLTYDGKPLTYNSFNQAFIAEGELEGWHQDIRIKADTIAKGHSYSMVNLRYKRKPWRMKARYAMTLGDAFEVSSPVQFNSLTSSSTEYGIDLGLAVSGRTTSFGFYVGAAMSTSELSFAAGGYNYSYATTDSQGVEYNRTYNITEMTEGVQYSDIVIPAYISLDQRLFKAVTLGFSVGAKVYLNGETTVTPYHMEGSVSGRYASGTVSSGGDQFGSISGDYERFLYPNSYTRNPYDLSVTGGVTLNINLLRNSLFVYGKWAYEMGLTDVHKSEENPLYSNDAFYPMVYSAHKNQNIATRSFMDCVSYKRKAMWLEFGIMFKM